MRRPIFSLVATTSTLSVSRAMVAFAVRGRSSSQRWRKGRGILNLLDLLLQFELMLYCLVHTLAEGFVLSRKLDCDVVREV